MNYEGKMARKLAEIQGLDWGWASTRQSCHTHIKELMSIFPDNLFELLDEARCKECGLRKPEDERVQNGMKCGPCAY